MPKHNQPSGRPIHSECDLWDGLGPVCTCDTAYGFAGTDLDRAIAVAMRLDTRRRTETNGHAPDADESPIEATTEESEAESRQFVPAGEDYDGFWKRSEDLKCRRGIRLRPLTGYGRGPTWDRSKAANK